MRARWLLSPALTLALACGTEDGGGDAGDGGAAGNTSAGPAAGGAPATGGMPGTGAGQTCDDLGFCGQPEDPGCVTCSVTDGSCKDELEACDLRCEMLRGCYSDCNSDDLPCFNECEDTYPDAVDTVEALYSCILCIECPVSCNFDPSNC